MLTFPGEEDSETEEKMLGEKKKRNIFSFENKIPTGLQTNVVTWEEIIF